jgi:hypothetical protein
VTSKRARRCDKGNCLTEIVGPVVVVVAVAEAVKE